VFVFLGFNGREGLVISTVTYNDAGEIRPIMYRMSLAEMVVPYGAPGMVSHTTSFSSALFISCQQNIRIRANLPLTCMLFYIFQPCQLFPF